MKIVDGHQQEYADWKAKQGDPYGARIFSYAGDWANFTEDSMEDKSIDLTSPAAVAAFLGEYADGLSRLADTDSITGFVYGASVAVRSKCWIHGEELRRWHNLKTQIGTEGEKANESGGVLNPAQLVSLQPDSQLDYAGRDNFEHRGKMRSFLFLLLSLPAFAQSAIQPGTATGGAPAVATVCPSITVGSQIREFCTSSVTWHGTTNGSEITVEAIGGGGGGAGGTSNTLVSGGGGEYAKSTTVAYISGSNVTVTVGAGGTGGAAGGNGGNGGASSFGSTVIANGGSGGVDGDSSAAGGTGGTGTTLYNGGAGGKGADNGGGGAGGAGGPNGAGGNGGTGGNCCDAGNGGGGSGGGANGSAASSDNDGGAGGANYTASVAGGAGGVEIGGNGGGGDANGASGGGGGGQTTGNPAMGGTGGNGKEWGSYGSGGGAGGSSSQIAGANGGLYGGGGGAGGYAHSAGGSGGQGIVVITYTP